MIFLIEYSREDRSIVDVRQFSGDQRQDAEEARLSLELRLNREGMKREVVILEADDIDALHKTHGRYFKNLAELIETNIPH